MRIWNQNINVEELDHFSKGTLSHHLDIRYTGMGDDYLEASMPVDHRTIQPYGILHGGASAVLAETLGSLASNLVIEDNNKLVPVGIELNCSHLKSVNSGIVRGVARPIRLGGRLHVWEIKIFNDQNDLINISRLTTMIIPRRNSSS